MSERSHHHHESGVIESIQSLVVAFVLAMTFRGFITEGFVIPTGSMAPTLMGEHILAHSSYTGSEFPIGVARINNPVNEPITVHDPLLGQESPPFELPRQRTYRRMGDRILVVKSLYPFSEPDRFDIVVFKNPTDPNGESANYIKRLVGLPNEHIWLADGDVFVAPTDSDAEPGDYAIQRKPEHVQRAVWQRVHNSDYYSSSPTVLQRMESPQPWNGRDWDTSGRTYVCNATEPTQLSWQTSRRPLTDWASYNQRHDQLRSRDPFPWECAVSDLRIAAAVDADDPRSLEMRLRISTREHDFHFIVRGDENGGTAEVGMRADPSEPLDGSGPVSIDLPESGVFEVEFWHVDQAMHLYIDGERIASHAYDWTGEERMKRVAHMETFDLGRLKRLSGGRTGPGGSYEPPVIPEPPSLTWGFANSPVRLSRVRLDRDLYYRPTVYSNGGGNPRQPGFEELTRSNTPGLGTYPDKPATLGPDHFFMLGDNSDASQDSRVWGHAHPLVAEQIDRSPFLVNRKLIVGKAWVVYFPAPYRVTGDGYPVIPDFGRLRFIR